MVVPWCDLALHDAGASLGFLLAYIITYSHGKVQSFVTVPWALFCGLYCLLTFGRRSSSGGISRIDFPLLTVDNRLVVRVGEESCIVLTVV